MKLRILVTAGPTREHFDSVRFISNPSSGKMGHQIARQAFLRGHRVDLVTGPVDLPAPPKGVRVAKVTSAAEMFKETVARFAECDVVIMAAAVSDYRPIRRMARKSAKHKTGLRFRLAATRDILAHLGRTKKGRIVIGFAMEDHDHHAHAESKLKRKRCDAIVMNDLWNAGSDRALVQVLLADGGWQAPWRGRKQIVARRLVMLAEALHAQKAAH